MREGRRQQIWREGEQRRVRQVEEGAPECLGGEVPQQDDGAPTRSTAIASSWNARGFISEMGTSETVSAESAASSMNLSIRLTVRRLVCVTPFGRLVVPDVKNTVLRWSTSSG